MSLEFGHHLPDQCSSWSLSTRAVSRRALNTPKVLTTEKEFGAQLKNLIFLLYTIHCIVLRTKYCSLFYFCEELVLNTVSLQVIFVGCGLTLTFLVSDARAIFRTQYVRIYMCTVTMIYLCTNFHTLRSIAVKLKAAAILFYRPILKSIFRNVSCIFLKFYFHTSFDNHEFLTAVVPLP